MKMNAGSTTVKQLSATVIFEVIVNLQDNEMFEKGFAILSITLIDQNI
jgi:hypothetical protein